MTIFIFDQLSSKIHFIRTIIHLDTTHLPTYLIFPLGREEIKITHDTHKSDMFSHVNGERNSTKESYSNSNKTNHPMSSSNKFRLDTYTDNPPHTCFLPSFTACCFICSLIILPSTLMAKKSSTLKLCRRKLVYFQDQTLEANGTGSCTFGKTRSSRFGEEIMRTSSLSIKLPL